MNYLIIFLILLPHLSLFGINLSTDNQIFFLLPYTYLWFSDRSLRNFKIPIFIFIPLILMVIGFTLGNLIDTNYSFSLEFNISSLISYSLIPILFSIGYFLSRNPFQIYNSIRYVLLILLIVILIQNLFPNVFNPFIARQLKVNPITQEIFTSASRGKRALFSEPSFIPSFLLLYSFNMFFLKSFFLQKIKNKNLIIYLSIALIISLLSLSGQILICFIILSLASLFAFLGIIVIKIFKYIHENKFIISNFFIRIIISLISLVSILYFFITKIFSENSRINFFVKALRTDFTLVLIDDSLIWRLHAVYMPLMTPFIEPLNIFPNKSAYIMKSFAEGYPLKFAEDIYIGYYDWFTNLTGLKDVILPAKIYSIFGNLNYDFGFFGLLFAIFYFYKITLSIDNVIKNSRQKDNYFLRFFFPIIFILFSYINLSLLCPPYWFFSGMLYGLGKNNFKKDSEI